MKKTIFNLVITFSILHLSSLSISQTTMSQKSELEIWTKQTKVQEAIDFEKSINTKYEKLEQSVSLSKSIYPLLDKYKLAQPFISKRVKTGFLEVYAEYFYSQSDSTLRFVSYNWERDQFGNFFKKQEIWKEESGKLREYNSEYEKIKADLIIKFGKPFKQDSKPQTIKGTSGRRDYLSRKTIWQNEEYYAELSMIFETITYRIRLDYYWIK